MTVEASSTPVKVVGGDVSGIITGEQARELPLNGRNFVQLATLMPGVSEHDFLNVKDKGLLGGAYMSVSGSGVTANLWTVDGANNNDLGNNATFLLYPLLEAIEELKVLRNSYGPEFGGAGGAQINVVTRGGTNQFRGSGFYFVRNDAFNSTDYFLEKNNQPKGELQRNDFGGFVGGPIIKDRLFFFGGLEWNLEDRGSARVAQVPTLAERNGDFSAGPVCSTAPGIPIDPTTGRSFDGNRIPSDRISPGGHAFLSLFPLPNVAAAGESCNNWVTSVTSPINYRQEHVRGDWSIGNSARLMVRYTHDSWKHDAPSFQSNLWVHYLFPSVDSNWGLRDKSFVTSLNQTFGTNATNSLQFSYSANRITVRRGGDQELNARVVTAIPHLPDPKQTARGGHRSPALVGRERIRGSVERGAVRQQSGPVRPEGRLHEGLRQALRQGRRARQLQQEKRRHHRKRLVAEPGLLGLDRSQWLWRDDGQHPGRLPARGHGVWIFRVVGGAPGSDAVARRRGLLRRFLGSLTQPHLRLRHPVSIYFNPYTADDKFTSFVPALFNAALGADACNGNLQPPGRTWCEEANARGGMEGPNRSLMYQDYNNFAPRLGLAWDLKGDGKTAIRAGLGQFFQREHMAPVYGIARNTPFVQKISGTRTLDTNVEPCAGCFTQASGTPTLGREVDDRARTPGNGT